MATADTAADGDADPDGGGLADRLRRLEDLQAIQQLFIDYGRHLDAGDFPAYAALFTEDGEVLLGPVGRAQGRREIEALMTTALSAHVGETYHLVTGPRITLDGDRATASVNWTVVARSTDGAPTVSMIGRHEDVLVRTAEGWRIRRRRGLIDMPGRLPA